MKARNREEIECNEKPGGENREVLDKLESKADEVVLRHGLNLREVC